jgi:hypothetical protein
MDLLVVPLPLPPTDPVPRRGAGAAPLGPGHTVACHWAEDIKAGRLKPHEGHAERAPTASEASGHGA